MRAVDVVVVGGGSAGCVVAARLAETASRSVLLLEAGPDLRADPPDGMHDGWRPYREFAWGFVSEPDGRGVSEPLHRGRVLGGTSWATRFAMRGSPADFDDWARPGNAGWRFDDVMPYFLRLENDLDFGEHPWHGNAGPLPVTRYRDVVSTDYEAAVVGALDVNGFSMIEDHNRPGAVGAGRIPMTVRDGWRVTTADAYLPSGGTPPNLRIRSDAEVAAVVLDDDEAIGVQLLDGTVINAGWVVIAAGTYGSPTILMRSGIGPADDLRAVDVPVRVDLPGVGRNLVDHPGVDIGPTFGGTARMSPLLHVFATFSSATCDAAGAPDLALWTADPAGEPAETTIDVVLLKPESRGKVRLRSSDPTQPPTIELPGLREQIDVDRMCEGFLRGWSVANDAAMQRLCERPLSPPPVSSRELRQTVVRDSYSLPHTVGTCAMGPSPEAGAVVDRAGHVHGVNRLSVIDASVIPTALSGFSQIITIMTAERLTEELSRLV
jgi:choline dehydrogenase